MKCKRSYISPQEIIRKYQPVPIGKTIQIIWEPPHYQINENTR
jgi:hypothetical protein